MKEWEQGGEGDGEWGGEQRGGEGGGKEGGRGRGGEEDN